MLAVLGWNDGTEQEIYSIEEMIEKFSMARVHKAGARFDYEKAKWFNHEWIKKLNVENLQIKVKETLQAENIKITDEQLLQKVIELVKDRCILLTDFIQQAGYFFTAPLQYDEASVKPKWGDDKKDFFEQLTSELKTTNDSTAENMEQVFKTLASQKNIKVGELQMIFRVMLVGSKMGPAVFAIAQAIGKEETINRIKNAIKIFQPD